jgi:hypothetical protein
VPPSPGGYLEQDLGASLPEVAAPVEENIQEDAQAANWREVNKLLKEQKAALEQHAREKEELKYMLQQAIQKPQVEEEDEEIDIYAEDFGSKLERKLERAVEKTFDKIEKKKKNDPVYLENQARKKFSDFDSVMTPEHIDTIIKSNPLVHQAVMASGAPLEAAYQLISQSALYQSKQTKSNTSARLVAEERQKLAENLGKPRSSNSVPRSQAISAVHGFGRLSAAQAKEIHAETLRIKRGR